MIHNMSLMRKCLAIVLLVLKGTTEIIVSAKEYKMHEVGESLGWRVPPNLTYYSEWASGQNFSIGDGLKNLGQGETTLFEGQSIPHASTRTYNGFNWTGNGYHSVADTSKASYDNCTTEVTSITENGSLLVSVVEGNGMQAYLPLDQNRSYFFYCIVADHCARGQKFTINIGQLKASESCPNSIAPPLFLLAFPAFLSFIAIYFGYL